MEITKTNRELLFTRHGDVYISIEIENGLYKNGLIHGIDREADGVCLSEGLSVLKNLKEVLDEILPEITKAMVRTKPELEKET